MRVRARSPYAGAKSRDSGQFSPTGEESSPIGLERHVAK